MMKERESLTEAREQWVLNLTHTLKEVREPWEEGLWPRSRQYRRRWGESMVSHEGFSPAEHVLDTTERV